MITGTERILATPTDVPVAEVLLKVCAAFWPQGVFRDADATDDLPLCEARQLFERP